MMPANGRRDLIRRLKVKLSARWEGVVNATLRPIIEGKETQYPLCGSKGRVTRYGEDKISDPSPGFQPWTVQPVAYSYRLPTTLSRPIVCSDCVFFLYLVTTHHLRNLNLKAPVSPSPQKFARSQAVPLLRIAGNWKLQLRVALQFYNLLPSLKID